MCPAKDVVGGNEEVYTLFLTLFSVGIALGALLCNRLLKGQVHATFVPLGAVALSVFTIDLSSEALPEGWQDRIYWLTRESFYPAGHSGFWRVEARQPSERVRLELEGGPAARR